MFKKPIVFVNYRRSDAATEAGRLSSDLEKIFGKGFVFQDVDDIESGEKWIDRLTRAGEEAKVILTVIGPGWLKSEDNANRIMDENDWVRKELESAIDGKKVIIPILVRGGILPTREDLPSSVQALLDHQAFDIRTDRWKSDLNLLNSDLIKITGIKPLRDRVVRKLIYGLSFILLIALTYQFFGSELFSNQKSHQEGYVEESSEDFCPEFNNQAKFRTLLFPFKKVSGEDYDIVTVVKGTMSRIIESYNVACDIQSPNLESDRFFDLNEARRKCPECGPDVVFTGFYYDEGGKIGLEPKIGFCDPSFQGVALDENLLTFRIEAIPISQLSSDPMLLGAIDHIIQVFLGIMLTKSGEIEQGTKILQDAVSNHPENRTLNTEALKVIWQNQYKLDQKAECARTLAQLYEIDKNSVKILAQKSIVEFEQKNYHEAIKDLDAVIDKVNDSEKKTKFIEKRGDAHLETEQYQKAKLDYQEVEQTQAIKAKIRGLDQKISRNEAQINGFQTSGNLTIADKARLAELQIQNGRTVEAERVLRTIDYSTLSRNQRSDLSSKQNVSLLIKEKKIQGN